MNGCMRCLYCGKQLALLKRLTGGGEFCSEAHKQSYHDEYNRLALSRLLQAQSKSDEVKPPAPKPVGSAQPVKSLVPVETESGWTSDQWTNSRKRSTVPVETVQPPNQAPFIVDRPQMRSPLQLEGSLKAAEPHFR